jgi:hypothetical protein
MSAAAMPSLEKHEGWGNRFGGATRLATNDRVDDCYDYVRTSGESFRRAFRAACETRVLESIKRLSH